jgi:hypothetical protein
VRKPDVCRVRHTQRLPFLLGRVVLVRPPLASQFLVNGTGPAYPKSTPQFGHVYDAINSRPWKSCPATQFLISRTEACPRSVASGLLHGRLAGQRLDGGDNLGPSARRAGLHLQRVWPRRK